MTEWWQPFVGLPFGQGPGRVTCWGLVRRVYADRLGVELPEHGDVAPDDLRRVALAMTRGAEAETWAAPAAPRPLDVVLMRHPTAARIGHVGVMVDAARVLHVEAATASVVVPVWHWSVRSRIGGFRRWVGA